MFWYLVNRTPLGRAQRACEQDRKMAALLGVDVDRTISITFIMGAALAAVAGTMFLMYYGVVVFSDGFVPGVKAFTAAVLGGIGSLPGAVLGGLLIGFIESHVVGLFLDRLQGRRRLLDPGHRADLPAVRHSRAAGSRKGLTSWRNRSQRPATPAQPTFQRALREALYAGADLVWPVRAAHRPEDRPEHPQRTDPGAALGPARDHRGDHGDRPLRLRRLCRAVFHSRAQGRGPAHGAGDARRDEGFIRRHFKHRPCRAVPLSDRHRGAGRLSRAR